MNKLFFILFCCCLFCVAPMTVEAQEENATESVFKQIALNDKEDIAIRISALTRITDQNELKQIALNINENVDVRRSALSQIK